ncbi:MAG: hypoxanthine phosphoribosyltransferase [Dehalococcoidia bacterium]
MKRILSRRQLQYTVGGLADHIRADYAGKRPVLIGILKGSFIFLADLARELNMPLEIDFVTVSSYGQGQVSKGEVTLIQDVTADIRDRHVLLVEDIVDSGLTLAWLRRHILGRSPASLAVCALLARESIVTARPDVVDYLGRAIPDGFVVGYGIDYGEDYRYLPDIWVLEEE